MNIIDTISMSLLLILLHFILVFIVAVFDMAVVFITFEIGGAKEYMLAKGDSAFLTIPGCLPSTRALPTSCN